MIKQKIATAPKQVEKKSAQTKALNVNFSSVPMTISKVGEKSADDEDHKEEEKVQ